MKIEREFNFNNIYLKPQKCVVSSRSECNLCTKLGNYTFNNPVIAANMESVVNYKTCKYLASKNMFYIMHRFNLDQKEYLDFIKDMKETSFASISVGVKDEDKKMVKFLKELDLFPEYITIDIAHAHSDRTVDMIKHIKDLNPDTFVIAGNVATKEAVQFLEENNADCCKLQIAPGCFVKGTKVTTKSGNKEIEEIEIGDEVLTHKCRYKKVVSKLARKEEKELLNINKIKCTLNHEFYVVHKKFKDLINEDNIDNYAEWKRADELNKDYLLIEQTNDK